MNIKNFASKKLPRRLVCHHAYAVREKRAKKTYAEAEAELNARFEKVFGRPIDWENPTTYNEKLQVTKLYGATPLKTRLTDKILVVNWVKERLGDSSNTHRGGSSASEVGDGRAEFGTSDGEAEFASQGDERLAFIPLIAAYDSIDEIDFSKLPDRYVMKMNNDSGSVFIHDEKHPLTKDWIAKYRYYFQKRNYAWNGYEMQYRGIKPKIMIEKYMGGAIRDYKFQCFGGKVYSCQVDFDRFSSHTRNFYDKNWQLLPYNDGDYTNYPEPVRKPENFEKMWGLAAKLSAEFDQVRVDFYDIDGIVYFGEMTFTSASGFKPYHPFRIDKEMGALWQLDMAPIRARRKKLLEARARLSD